MSATADAAAPHLVWRRCHDRGRTTVLSLYGECDLATRGQLQVALAQAVSGDDEDVLILDLSRLDFCDVGCARLICDASRAGHVVVTGMSASVGRMFDLLDLDLTLSRSGAVPDNLHLVPTQRRGLSTSTTSTSPSRDTDGARRESTDVVHPPPLMWRTSPASMPPSRAGSIGCTTELTSSAAGLTACPWSRSGVAGRV